MNKKIFITVRLAITAAIVAALFTFIPYAKIVQAYRFSHKGTLFLSLFVFLLNYFVGALRWRFFLTSLGVEVKRREVFYAFFCGQFFNLFFPSFIAGDIFRGASLNLKTGQAERKKIASSVFMDRLSGASGILILALAALGFGSGLIIEHASIVSSLLLLALAMLFLVFIIFTKYFFYFSIAWLRRFSRLHGVLVNFHEQVYFFRKKPIIFVKSLLFSLAVQVLTVLGFYLGAKAFYADTSLVYFFILVPIVTAISVVPITIAGIGTREASAVYFFSLIGIEKSIGLGISLLNFFSMLLVGVAGGVLYVTVYHRYLQPDSRENSR